MPTPRPRPSSSDNEPTSKHHKPNTPELLNAQSQSIQKGVEYMKNQLATVTPPPRPRSLVKPASQSLSSSSSVEHPPTSPFLGLPETHFDADVELVTASDLDIFNSSSNGNGHAPDQLRPSSAPLRIVHVRGPSVPLRCLSTDSVIWLTDVMKNPVNIADQWSDAHSHPASTVEAGTWEETIRDYNAMVEASERFMKHMRVNLS
jgi:hypothetical protein